MKGKKTTNSKEKLAKKRKAKRRGQNTLYYLLFGVLCVAIGLVMSFTVFFRIDLIKVTPNPYYQSDEIIEVSGIMIGDNLFRLSSEEVSDRLLRQFPYIEKVSLKRMLPSILEISLEMAEPIASVEIDEVQLVVNKEGRVLDYLEEDDLRYRRAEGFENEPFDPNRETWYRDYRCTGGIEHDGIQDMEKGDLDDGDCKAGYRHTGEISRKKLSKGNLEKLNILKIMEEIFEKYELDRITAVALQDSNDLFLLYDHRLLISVGNINELDYKLQFAAYTINNNVEDGYTGLLDVSVPKYARLRGVNIFAEEYWPFSSDLREEIIGDIMPSETEPPIEGGTSTEDGNQKEGESTIEE